MDEQEKQRLAATLRQRIDHLISASKGHASEMYWVTHVAIACALASLELGLEADRASLTEERKRAYAVLVVEQVGEALLRTEQVLADDFVHAITSEIEYPLEDSAEENQEGWIDRVPDSGVGVTG